MSVPMASIPGRCEHCPHFYDVHRITEHDDSAAHMQPAAAKRGKSDLYAEWAYLLTVLERTGVWQIPLLDNDAHPQAIIDTRSK
jgi:hypothetical protein